MRRATSVPLPPTSFGAVCPKEGKGAALILPACNSEAMNLHLAEIAKAGAPAAHAILLVDQAGWHLSTRLVVPHSAFNCAASLAILPSPSTVTIRRAVEVTSAMVV